MSGLLLACQPEQGSGDNQDTQETSDAPVEEESQVPIYAGDATTASPDEVPQANKNGSFMKPTPLPNSETVNILNRDFWVMEFYVADEKEVRLGNKGRWFRFYKDGTFENGRWTKKLGYGAWNLQNVPGQGLTLILDNIDDSQDEQWEIQGVNESGDTMTWVGINKTNNSGHVVKAINLLTRPTRKQFGAEGIQ
jgi:hypothetical protein